jgi:hypothetical protein
MPEHVAKSPGDDERARRARVQRVRIEEFRAHAAQCQALARRIRDLELKRLSQQLARQWLELAERAERAATR